MNLIVNPNEPIDSRSKQQKIIDAARERELETKRALCEVHKLIDAKYERLYDNEGYYRSGLSESERKALQADIEMLQHKAVSLLSDVL